MNKDFEKQHPRNSAGRFERKSQPAAKQGSTPAARGKSHGGRMSGAAKHEDKW